MKVFLLMPPTNLASSYGKLKYFANCLPAIGLAYIAAVLRQNNVSVTVVDAYVNQYGLDDILNKIKNESPDVVGISMLTTSADVVTSICQAVRKDFPLIKIILGNVHASLFAEEILQKGVADFIVHREGEYTMLDLVKVLSGTGSPREVSGISFIENGLVIHTAPRPFIEDLDALPYPAWELFPLEKYATDTRTELIPGERTMQILSTRGCPNVCTFCSSHTDKNLGFRYRMRDPKKVVDEMEYIYKTFGIRTFQFIDLAFPLVKSHAISLCQEIIDRGLHDKIKWSSELRVKPIDSETLQIMKKSGCKTVIFGTESGSDRILRLLRKNFTTDDARAAVKMTREAGIDADGMFMLGLPEETEEEILQTINFAIELNLRYVTFNLFVPYPGCELYDLLKSQDKIHFKNWADFTSYPTYTGGIPVYIPDGMTKERLMDLQKLFMKKFYLRPQFILGEIKRFKLNKLAHYWNGLLTVLDK